MTDVYAKAKEKRKALLAQIAEIDAFLALYERLAAEESAIAATSASAMPKAPTAQVMLNPQAAWPFPTQGETKAIPPLARPPSKRELIEAASAAVLAARQPLTTEELLELLMERGVEVGGTQPAVSLSSYLSKSEKFVHRRRDGGWFLEKEGFEKARQNQLPDLDGPST